MRRFGCSRRCDYPAVDRGRWSSRSCRAGPRRLPVHGPCRTGCACRASSASCTTTSPGNCSPLSWGPVLARPAGGFSSAGSRPESSTNCTASCSPGCIRPASWTGPERASAAPTSARKRGSRHRSVAGRPAQDGQQTPPDLRRTRHSTQGRHHRGQRQRHPPRPSPWSTASRPSPAARADPAGAPRPCSATRATTPTPTAANCASAGSCRSSPAKAHRTSKGWASSATSSSRLSPCSTSPNASPFAGSAAPNSTTPPSPSPAASSAGDASRRPTHDRVTSSTSSMRFSAAEQSREATVPFGAKMSLHQANLEICTSFCSESYSPSGAC